MLIFLSLAQTRRETALAVMGGDSGCSGCGGRFGPGVRFLTLPNGACFHPRCFLCSGCGQPISGTFATTGSGGATAFWHPSCHHRLHTPACDVCGEPLKQDANGVVRFSSNPFWQQKWCAHHKPTVCSACNRVAGPRSDFVTLRGDGPGTSGRPLCGDCCESVVASADDVTELYRQMRSFFRTCSLELPAALPIQLVGSSALDEAHSGSGHCGHTRHSLGLTMAERHVTRRMRNHVVIPGSEKVHTEVFAILILNHLPKILFQSVLAHELLHAFFRLNDFPTMSPQVEEGACQLMSYLYLKAPQSREDVPANYRRHVEYYETKIWQETSPVYGDGFRLAFAAYERYGLRRLISHLKETGDFPL